MLSETELKMLVKGGETNTVELKLAAPRAVDLAERFCGMANARGGIVLIGVEDSTRKVVGVPDERIGETMDVILRAARQVIKPELVLNPPEPEVYMLAGKKLLVATIPPTEGPIYQAGGIFWIRQGTQTRALSMAELSEMIYDRGLRDWELEPAFNATMEDIDLEKVQSFIARRSSSGRQSNRFKDIEQVLIGMRCALEVSSGTIVPTNAGILFFGQSPQDHIPQSEVVCVLFRESVGASRYADRKIVTGTLQDVIDNTEAFLNRYIAVGARIEGWKRIDIPEYSIEVLREAVINAVVHRDYSKRGERVRVFYYPDRVEVHSPGLLLPGITVEQMERGEVQSKLRNPVLGGLLSSLPGYMEQIGSGVRFMLDETKRLGLPAPQFRQMSEFIVTFQSAPALRTSESQLPYEETLWEEYEDTPPEIMVQNRHTEQIEKRLIKALHYVQEHGFITNGIYRQLTGVTDRTAHRDLEKLVERGRLKASGQRAARRYVLA